LVLESGAAHPYLWCEWCGRTTKAPARETWKPGRPADAAKQLPLAIIWATDDAYDLSPENQRECHEV